MRPVMVRLLEGVPFNPLGTIHERVLFWEALDAFMFVVASCGVTRAVVVPVEAYIRPLFRIKAFDVFVGWDCGAFSD